MRAWSHLAVLALNGSNDLLNSENILTGPSQQGGACVQDSLAAAITTHHHTINGDTRKINRRTSGHILHVALPPSLGPSQSGSSGKEDSPFPWTSSWSPQNFLSK